jgi:hypothetical protein
MRDVETVSLERQRSALRAPARLARQLQMNWPPLLALLGVGVLMTLATIYHYAIYLPQPNQPHRLTALDDVFALGVVLLLGVVGLGLGRRALRLFNVQALSQVERGVLALGLGWGLLILGTLALGLAHLLFTWLIIALLGVALLLFWKDVWRVLALMTGREGSSFLRMVVPQTWFEWALAAVMAIEMALLGTQALTLPINPRGWDLYTYHWAGPQLFLLHHAVYVVPGWANIDFPINTEMLNTLALAFDAPIAAVLTQMVFGLLTVLLICSFLYRHLGRLAAWLGAALCMSSPLFIGYLISGFVEPAVAYYGVASLVVVLLWLDRARVSGTPSGERLLLLAGLFAGFGVGAKYQAGEVLVGIGALLVGVAAIRSLSAWREQGTGWPVLRHFLLGMLLYGSGVLLALFPWLLRDWLLLGNPIYPFIWGGAGWNASRTQVATEWLAHWGPDGPLWRRLLEAFYRLFRDNSHMDDPPYLALNGLLALAPVLVVVELLRAWKKLPGWAAGASDGAMQGIAWLVVAGGAYGVWVVARTTSSRYAMPWVLLLVVPAVIVLVRLFQFCLKRRVALALLQLVVLVLVLQLGLLASLTFWADAQPLPLLIGQVSLRQWEEEHLEQSSGYWQMVDYVNAQIPDDAKLLLVGNGFGYFLQGHDYVDDSAEDWVPYLMTAGQTPSDTVRLLREQGFTYLVYQEQNLQYIIHAYHATVLAQYLPGFHHFLDTSLIHMQTFEDYTLYRIPAS